MSISNIFKSISKDFDGELFDVFVQNKAVKIERIVSKGHISSDWYVQEKNEWVIVLKGEAIVSFEGEEEACLREGDFLNIPAHIKHRVKWTQPDIETVWLAIHYQ